MTKGEAIKAVEDWLSIQGSIAAEQVPVEAIKRIVREAKKAK